MNRSFIGLFSLFIFSFLIILNITGCESKKDSQPDDVVGNLNSSELFAKELRFYMSLNKAAVASYFFQKYGAEADGEFWNKKFEGNEIPVDILRKRAIDQMIYDQALKQIALRKGLLQQTSYSSFLEEMEKENKTREQAKANGEVVYGPVRFEERAFYHYYFSVLETKLRNGIHKEQHFDQTTDVAALQPSHDSLDAKINQWVSAYIDSAVLVVDSAAYLKVSL